MSLITCFNYDQRALFKRILPQGTCARYAQFADRDCIDGISSSSLILYHYIPVREFELGHLATLKTTFPSIPIVVSSFTRNNPLALWALRMRIWDVVILPHELEHLACSIRALLNRGDAANDGSRISIFPAKSATVRIRGNPRTSRTDAAIGYIHKNITKRLRIEELAAACGLSVGTFSRQFKQEQGSNVRDYIKSTRINAAKEFLHNSELPISEVAFRAGYEDLSLFNRLFKGAEGKTPTQYRDTTRKNRKID